MALFLSLHLGKIGPGPDEARALGRIIRRTGLSLGGLVSQIAHIAAHRADQIVLTAIGLRDHALAAQLLDPTFREIQQPRDYADGLGCRRHEVIPSPRSKQWNCCDYTG